MGEEKLVFDRNRFNTTREFRCTVCGWYGILLEYTNVLGKERKSEKRERFFPSIHRSTTFTFFLLSLHPSIHSQF